MKKNLIILAAFFSIASFLFLSSCVKDEGKIPVAAPVVQACDTITWSKHIRALTTSSCMPCHDDAHKYGTFSFITYEGIKTAADAGKIYNVIFLGKPRYMPYNTANVELLKPAEKELIRCWLENGKKKD
jgi:hypothetical protein